MNNEETPFGDRPERNALPDDWIESPAPARKSALKKGGEPMVRISVDVPKSLHKKAKKDCVDKDTTLAAMLRQYLFEKYDDI